jgi:hypothetical protein
MPIDLMALGLLPPTAEVGKWLISQLVSHAGPHIERFLRDPAGSVSRLGDLLVWQSPAGRQVIATLEGLSDSQARIEQVVGRIETAQIGVNHSLGALTSLSMTSLGMLSLASGLMVWRMNALDQRLSRIGGQITDIQTHLRAAEQAHLETSLAFLGKFEEEKGERDLHTALEESTYATSLYRGLVNSELASQRRLVALNQCGRYYFLALTAQARCLILSNQLKRASQLLADERRTLTELAKSTFDEVLGKSPEVFFDPAFQADNVTLELLTDLYRQAYQIGAVDGAPVGEASQLFERLRSGIYGAGRKWFAPAGHAKRTLLARLKYLIACLEEIARIESLRLRIGLAIDGRLSFQELDRLLASSQELGERAKHAEDVLVFGIP